MRNHKQAHLVSIENRPTSTVPNIEKQTSEGIYGF